MAVAWQLQTPATGPGAIGLVALSADSAAALDDAMRRLGIAPVAAGRLALRSMAGVERGVVARWSGTSAHLMPHAGHAVIRALTRALLDAGIPEAPVPGAGRDYPEASSMIESRMLAGLARAASPLAIDLLLDQPRRWASHAVAEAGSFTAPPSERDRVLRRLIDPPLVVTLGPPNVGKSTLVNALAGRAVSIVADEPGTTRDHVGVTLDCGGLVVRYADTPGLRGPPSGRVEADAAEIALRLAADADLVLLCGDAGAPPPERATERPSLRVALRSDLGLPAWPHDLGVCARDGHGIEALVRLIRDSLVLPTVLAGPEPWRFWTED